MPIHGTESAPKFNGKMELLNEFLDQYEDIADQAVLAGQDCIKGLIRYLSVNDKELWAGVPEAQLGDFDAFIKVVKVMYPGCEGDRYFTLTDLHTLSHNQSARPMRLHIKLGDYFREYIRVSQYLLAKAHIGEIERNCIFLEGFPSDVQAQIRMRLMIKFPDHHHEDPYPMTDVHKAAIFLLPGIAQVREKSILKQVQRRELYVLTCVLDQGAEVVVMPEVVWKMLGVGMRSDYRLNMESVNTSKDATLGIIENILLDFRGGPMYFQVQVTKHANFDILLGHPFFKLTSCHTSDLPDGEQDIFLTDPNTRKQMRIPTLPWLKRGAQGSQGQACADHSSKKMDEGF
ncbi:hypothetical protein BDR05DRAFT_892293 [Suillus weaverae]|nr:hypothetical protein BDR05DRAFT_892293 [Suillus weaverae]